VSTAGDQVPDWSLPVWQDFRAVAAQAAIELFEEHHPHSQIGEQKNKSPQKKVEEGPRLMAFRETRSMCLTAKRDGGPPIPSIPITSSTVGEA